jgi:hypothetical protein
MYFVDWYWKNRVPHTLLSDKKQALLKKPVRVAQAGGIRVANPFQLHINFGQRQSHQSCQG